MYRPDIKHFLDHAKKLNVCSSFDARKIANYALYLEAENARLVDRLDALEPENFQLKQIVEYITERPSDYVMSKVIHEPVTPDEPHKHTDLRPWPIG